MALETVANEPKKLAKNFRQSADIENFYRFIHENDLRKEAKLIFEKLHAQIKMQNKKKKAKRKSKAKAKKVLH